MRIIDHWRAWSSSTKTYLVAILFFAAIVTIGAVNQARFERLPAAEQARIVEQQRTEQARILEQRRLAQSESAREQREERAKRAAEDYRHQLDEIHKSNVKTCVESAKKYLPGLWPSFEAEAKIEADCAEREARSE